MKDKIKKILEIYKNDEKHFGGYTAIERLNYIAPEDYIESRTEWDTLRNHADDMYYMLNEIQDIIKEIDEEL
jgi:hypothetical protein